MASIRPLIARKSFSSSSSATSSASFASARWRSGGGCVQSLGAGQTNEVWFNIWKKSKVAMQLRQLLNRG